MTDTNADNKPSVAYASGDIDTKSSVYRHAKRPSVAIIGAGAAGLMAADFLGQYAVEVHIFDKMPTAGRKILWAGKTGLNLTHSEPMSTFVTRYTPDDWLQPYLMRYGNDWLVAWLRKLGVETYVGSSKRVFPTQMKASGFLRSWLARLQSQGVHFHYRHECISLDGKTLTFIHHAKEGDDQVCQSFDAIVMACGGGSYARLGSDGAWQAWFCDKDISPLYASNVGCVRAWSDFMKVHFGQALKGVSAWIDLMHKARGDIIISHYGLESGVIYRLNHAMRERLSADNKIVLVLDLLPQKSAEEIHSLLIKHKKQSLNNRLRKAGLDGVKIALLRECTPKNDWQDSQKMAMHIKALPIECTGFRPMDEAISTGGGIKRARLGEHLQYLPQPYLFCAGEMLDWDAPTGGYLLTACFATGRIAGEGVARFLGVMD